MRVRPFGWNRLDSSKLGATKPGRVVLGSPRRIGMVVAMMSMVALPPVGAVANGLVGARAHVEASPSAIDRAALAVSSGVLDAPVATVTAAHLDDGAESAKLTFDLAPGAEVFKPSVFVLANPDRVIVDLPRVDFPRADLFHGDMHAPAETRKTRHHGHGTKTGAARVGLVASYRFGLFAPGRSRVVVDLAGPVKILGAAVKTEGATSKLVIAFAKTDAASFLAAAQGRVVDAAKTPEAPRAVPAAGKTTIVIDPGHGGPDNGAIVDGIVEKDVTLAFAKMLAGKLEAAGAFNVVMTRSSDVFIPLSERVHVARGAEAALMISVHADTLPESADVNGTTVYTVSDRASDAYAAKVAAKENEADASVGLDGQADKADVNDILFDLTRQETRAYSHVFARTLVNYWKVVGRLNKNPNRAAGFVVLKAPDVPSVLVELGYLSNPLDSAALTSDEWREKATGRMAEAIVAYFADRHGAASATAGASASLKQADLAVGLRK